MAITSLEYVHGSPPTGYSLAFEPFLYNQEAFLALKSYPVQSFYAVNHQKRSIEARIHFTVKEQKDGTLRAISLPELPFGSLEYSSSLTTEQITSLLGFVQEKLAQQGCNAIEIRDCISEYRIDSSNLVSEILIKVGLKKHHEDINHFIPVDETAFRFKIHRMAAKRLRKCHRANFHFALETSQAIPQVYEFIRYCRAEQGWDLSMSLEQLMDATSYLPNRYRFFSVFDQDRRIAAATVVIVNDYIMYDFYHDALQSYNRFSPTIFLLERLYEYCRERNLQSLDLGTSTSSSLAAFKGRVGGVLSYKKTYMLEW